MDVERAMGRPDDFIYDSFNLKRETGRAFDVVCRGRSDQSSVTWGLRPDERGLVAGPSLRYDSVCRFLVMVDLVMTIEFLSLLGTASERYVFSNLSPQNTASSRGIEYE